MIFTNGFQIIRTKRTGIMKDGRGWLILPEMNMPETERPEIDMPETEMTERAGTGD